MELSLSGVFAAFFPPGLLHRLTLPQLLSLLSLPLLQKSLSLLSVGSVEIELIRQVLLFYCLHMLVILMKNLLQMIRRLMKEEQIRGFCRDGRVS